MKPVPTPLPETVVTEGYAPPTEAQRQYMFITYTLFALAPFLGGVPLLVGVILAYLKRDEMAATVYYEHLCFLIKTFWVTLIAGLIGAVLMLVLVGFLVLALLAVWYIVRVAVGAVKCIDRQPVTATGWLI